MVTTRSADKRATTEVKVEDLALRSRATEVEAASQSTPTPSRTIIKRTKITVDIPTSLEKKPDLSEGTEDDSSYATARDGLGSAQDIDSQFAEAARSFDSSGVATRIEIPDSQETATTPKKDVLASSQDFVSFNDDTIQSTPVSARTRGTKRKLDVQSTPTNQVEEDPDATPKASSENKHKRFGSEDPADSDTVIVAIQSDQDTQDQPVDNSDEDDAPEVVSTKQTTTQTSSTRGNKRRKAAQPQETPIDVTKAPLAPTPTISAHSAESDTTIQAQEGFPIATEHSFSDSSATLPNISDVASQEIGQSLSSHPDMLQLSSSDVIRQDKISEQTTSSRDTSATIPAANSTHNMRNLHTDLSTLHIRRPRHSRPASFNNSSSLPPKASSKIEDYRRSKMTSRRNFRLEADWSTKRRRFVLA